MQKENEANVNLRPHFLKFSSILGHDDILGQPFLLDPELIDWLPALDLKPKRVLCNAARTHTGSKGKIRTGELVSPMLMKKVSG